MSVLGKIGKKHLSNILGATLVDAGVYTLPQTVKDIVEKKSVGTILGNILLDSGKNLGLNIAGEGAGALIGKVSKVASDGIKRGKGSLSNVEARKWYLEHEAKIPDMIDSNLTLEEQAKQAFNLRNQFRTDARELMSDRTLAESLYKIDPNWSWEKMVQKQMDKGLTGDDIYKEIIASAQRSRKTVNKSLGLE